MIMLDTPVLLYAKGAAHPLREPCRELVDAIDAVGKLLSQHFPPGTRDSNELADHLIVLP